ncbi:MAG TPA: deoxyguanosinetriphosphate triphosphohydrolase [Bacillota bacterium]|nr:deoxyguanosinetriphosphate triphosphohydrolase [Bacillota bacterium]HOA14982.1 deoxyguanosinetriphosphate triphosphohydrolase [Bacillota bacterium]HOG52986.1 deoxyguanosinetriphosphate triphosphohydrolase [Bacillota bacterium]
MEFRLAIEKRERLTLSPFATFADSSRGRAFPEEEDELRTCFQRDRDRIIHCKAFRRLKHKTQVFYSPEGDHYRTRLTHTLEVSQIARTMAAALALNENLTEAIAMGHDLGHTPFGHAGEAALNTVVPGGFQHNVQSIRVVESVERREGRQAPGLNLTWEVKDGILAHSWGWEPRATTLEGQLVMFADKIAYINHDFDDAVRAGIISESDVPKEVKVLLGADRRKRLDFLVMDIIKESTGKGGILQSKEAEYGLGVMRDFMFERVYNNTNVAKEETERCKRLVIQLYLYYINFPEQLAVDSGHEFKLSDRDSISQAAVDYVAGMTDRYAVKVFSNMYIPKPWQIY